MDSLFKQHGKFFFSQVYLPDNKFGSLEINQIIIYISMTEGKVTVLYSSLPLVNPSLYYHFSDF